MVQAEQDLLAMRTPPNLTTALKQLIEAETVERRVGSIGHERGFLFYTTHVSNPFPARIGLKAIEIILCDNLTLQAKLMDDRLMSGLLQLQKRFECIGDVRGRGLLVGIEFVSDRDFKTPAALSQRCFEI